MTIKHKIIGLVLFAALLTLPSMGGVARAHEEVADEVSGHSLTVHIDPDEKPVAGEAATITYLLDNDFPVRPFTAKLTIQGIDAKHFAELDPVITEDKIFAPYVFPAEGKYKLELVITEPGSEEKLTFSETVSVARGKETVVMPEPGLSAPLKAGIAAANVLLLGVIIFGFVKNKKSHK